MSNTEEEDARLAAIEEAATDADPDTEEKLARLYELAAILREDPVIKAEYEMLRNELVRQMKEEGPRWFTDHKGHKHLAHPIVPETTYVDLELLIQMYEKGEISRHTLDTVAPRKQSLEGLRKAITSGALSSRQVARLCSFAPKGAGYVGWLDPESGAGE